MKMNYSRACFFHISQVGRVQLRRVTAVQFSYLSNGMTDLVYKAAPVALIILCNSVGICSTERPANNVCSVDSRMWSAILIYFGLLLEQTVTRLDVYILLLLRLPMHAIIFLNEAARTISIFTRGDIVNV